MSIGSLLIGSGICPNAPRIAASTSTMCAAASPSPCFPAGGFSTHRITKNPIISMTRSANVKIHSGHSSHSSAFLHLQAGLAMGGYSCRLRQGRLLLGGEEAEELHFHDAGVVAGLDAQYAV